MKNKYIVPISREDDAWNEVVYATSFEDARNKVIELFINDYEFDCPDDWVEFHRWMWEHYYAVGDPVDIETL